MRPCAGIHEGFSGMESAVSPRPTELHRRMGSLKAEIFLGSAATVAASARTGVLTDPGVSLGFLRPGI